MRNALIISLLWAFVSAGAVLEWDANTETNIAGYRVFWGPQSGSYSNNLTVTNTTATISNSMMFPGTNYFVVTAFDTDGLESDYSDEVNTRRRPLPPTRLKISDRLVVQQSVNLQEWVSVATNLIDTTSGVAFFRTLGEEDTTPASVPKRLRLTAGSKVGKL